jgi:hypothetical protein
MCIVSFISDHYNQYPAPDYNQRNLWKITTTGPSTLSDAIDWTKAAPASLPWTKDTLAQLKRIMADLKTLDAALGLADCEDPKKAEWLKTIETWVDRVEAAKQPPAPDAK